jgi:Fe-S-cluster containining protein
MMPATCNGRQRGTGMEFTIDFATVRQITTQEYRQARAEIAELGAANAYVRSCERHDARLAAAPDARTLACRAGCSWCCHFSVDVRPVEAFRILDFMRAQLGEEQQRQIKTEIEANAKRLRSTSDLQRAQLNVKCPFLHAGRCTIYAARPQTCRNYHATEVAGCQRSYEQPDNADIDPDFAPLVYQIGGSHVDAFSTAMAQAGYDVAAYELSSALLAAMSDPHARARFESRGKAFIELEGMEVPAEFMELEES